MSFKVALGVVGALGLAVAGQSAQALTLQDLINNGTPLVAGDKILTNFSAGGTLAASAITVNAIPDSGVQFTGNWNTLTPGSNSAVIGYTISVAPNANMVISGANLFFAGQVVVNGGTAFVGETLTDVATNKDYSMQVFYDGPGGNADNLRASVAIAPSTTSLRVIKSIDVAAPTGGFAALNFVENTFVQTPGNGGEQPGIPEPASLALLPLGIVGLALRKKLAR